MATNEPFGFDPDDLDRIFPGMGEQLRGALGQLGRLLNGSDQGAGWSGLFDEFGRHPRPTADFDPTGNTGDGVWVIYTVSGDPDAQVEQIYATELDALRANKHNTDSNRRVRFLPYGIPVSVLDEPEVPHNPETTVACRSDGPTRCPRGPSMLSEAGTTSAGMGNPADEETGMLPEHRGCTDSSTVCRVSNAAWVFSIPCPVWNLGRFADQHGRPMRRSTPRAHAHP